MKENLAININDFKKLNFKAIYAWPIVPKITFLMAVTGLTVIGSYFVYINGKIDEFKKSEKKEVSLKEEFIDMKKEAINIPVYQNQLKEIETTFGTILKQLPNKLNMDDLIRDINQAGLSRNLEFVLFEPEKTEIKKEFYAELPINIEVKGTFYDVGSFTADLASLSRIVVLTDIKINSLDNSDMVTMSAKARSYRYLTEEEIAEQIRIAKEKEEAERKKGGLLGKIKGKTDTKTESKTDKGSSKSKEAEKPRNSVAPKTRAEVEKEKQKVQEAKK